MKDRKNLIIIILSIVVVILLIMLAFMFGMNAGRNTPVNNNSVVTTTPEPTSENPQTPTEHITPELWVLLSQQTENVRRVLAERLNDSLSSENKNYNKVVDEALSIAKSLSETSERPDSTRKVLDYF